MNDTIREQLSALTDGELASDSARFLLKRLDHDPELAETWERYHLIRDQLRRQQSLAPTDFASGVMARIAAEERGEIGKLHRTAGSGWARWVGGGAIAAAVTAVALFASLPTAQVDTGPSLANVESVTTADLAPAWQLSPVSRRTAVMVSDLPSAGELDAYFMQHGEASAAGGSIGMLPMVQAVAARPAQVSNCEGARAC